MKAPKRSLRQRVESPRHPADVAIFFGLAFALIFAIFTWRLGASDALVPALAGSLGATLGWQLRNGRR